MSESLLKKEFKESDVQRARNLVNKDFTKKTKLQSGYQKSYKRYEEGDIWEESGKTWTIKNGLKQNITKLDAAKKAVRIPLTCPKCAGPMKQHLAKKMFRIHGVCFDCVINMEADLQKAGLYDEYEKNMMQGNVRAFAKDIQEWVDDFVNEQISFVTEQGDVEDWNSNQNIKKKVATNLNTYLGYLKEHM